MSHVRAVCALRPACAYELLGEEVSAVGTQVQVDGAGCEFDVVGEVESTIKPQVDDMVAKAIAGVNVIALGFRLAPSDDTLVGTTDGVVPLFLEAAGRALSTAGTAAPEDCTLSIDAVDVVGDQLRDLLNFSGLDKRLKLRQHPRLGVQCDALQTLTYAASKTDAAIDAFADAMQVRAVGQPAGHKNATFTVVRVTLRSGDLHSSVAFVETPSFERFASASKAEGLPVASTATIDAFRACLEGFAADGAAWKRRWKQNPLTHFLTSTFSDGHCALWVLTVLAERAPSPAIAKDLFALASALRKMPVTGRATQDPVAQVLQETQEEMESVKHQLKLLDEGMPVPSGLGKPDLLQQLVEATELFQELSESGDEMLAKTKLFETKRANVKAKWAGISGHPFYSSAVETSASMSEVRSGGHRRNVALPWTASAPQTVPLGPDGTNANVVVNLETKTLTFTPPPRGEDLRPTAYVNGNPVTAETRLAHGDRVLCGDTAWIVSLPPHWGRDTTFPLMAAPFEPSSTADTCQALVQRVRHAEENPNDPSAVADANHAMQLLLAFHPMQPNPPVTAAWGFSQVTEEFERREKERRIELERKQAAERAQREAEENAARTEQQRLEEIERQAMEEAAAAEAARAAEAAAAREAEERARAEAEAAAAAAAAAQAAKAAEEKPTSQMNSDDILAQLNADMDGDDDEPEEFDIQVPPKKPAETDSTAAQDADGAEAADAAGPASGSTPPPAAEEEVQEEKAMPQGPRIDPVAEALAELDELLAKYRADAAAAFLWKPDGPTDELDRQQYGGLLKFSDAKDTAEKRRQAEPSIIDSGAECPTVFRLRTRRNIFNRGGAEPVHLLLSGRFVMYFPEGPAATTAATGQCYVYGATITKLEGTREGRRYILRIEPSTPRKGTKDRSAPSEQNDLYLSFSSEPERDRWLALLTRTSKPPVPEPLRRIYGNDVPIDTKPPRLPELDRNDVRLSLSKEDIDLVDEFLAMDDEALKQDPEIQRKAPLIVQLTTPEQTFDENWDDEFLRAAQAAATDEGHDPAVIMQQQALAATDGNDGPIDISKPFWEVRRRRFFHYSRTSTEPQAAAKIAKRGRAWLVNAVTATVELVDASAKLAFVFSTSQVISISRHANNPTGLEISVMHDGALNFREFFMTHADRESFLDVLNSARPALRLYAPSLVPSTMSDAVREVKVSNLDVGGKMKLNGSAYLRVTNELHENIRIWTGTVNVGGLPFTGPGAADNWIPLRGHDIYVVALQGLPPDADEPTQVPHFADHLRIRCAEATNGDYTMLRWVRCADMLLVLVVRRIHVPKISAVEVTTCPSQIGALVGERGGVAIGLRYLNTSIAFIAMHLPGQPQRQDLRRFVCQEILSNMQLGDTDCDECTEFDTVFVLGDLNFPVVPKQLKKLHAACSLDAEENEAEHVFEERRRAAIADVLKQHDMLTSDREANRILFGFSEGVVDFAPTAPIDPANISEPLWVDSPDRTPVGNGVTRYSGRVLFKARLSDDIQCLKYTPSYNWAASGQRPVHAEFALRCLRQACTLYAAPPGHTIDAAAPVGLRVAIHISDVELRRPVGKVPENNDLVLRVTSPGASLFEPVEINDATALKSGTWIYHDISCICRTHAVPLVANTSIAISILQVPRAAVSRAAATASAGEVKVLMSCRVDLSEELLKGAAAGAAEPAEEHTRTVVCTMQRGGQYVTQASLKLCSSLYQTPGAPAS